jgi:orotidine-5'-phosphate decarboxylase
VPLDVDTLEECMRFANLLSGKVGAFKVGPRLVVRYGATLIGELAKKAPVFVDNKYYDIPSTMEGAIRATFDSGATLATVHATSGHEALEKLAGLEKELNSKRPFKILAVTILTSFSQDSLPSPFKQTPIASLVNDLARLALDAGLNGIVCSPHEVASVRQLSGASFLVVPGIRMATDAIDDQKRTETPLKTMHAGANALVIGRPIIHAKDPVAAVEAILDSLKKGQS